MTILNGTYSCGLENNGIENNGIGVKFVPDADSPSCPQSLSITFHRTIRVPDNRNTSKLPPDLGTYPLFTVRDYANKLPSDIVAKGGVFLSMYQREAMWIDFRADWPFMIKIYAGGVNVVSGEHAVEDHHTKERRSAFRFGRRLFLQDYVVAPQQLWLDGIATSPGIVRQFVAMPVGQGYSVEAQLTGEETIGGLQFEITPSAPGNGVDLLVQMGLDKLVPIKCPPPYTISAVKNAIYDVEGTPPDEQDLYFDCKDCENHKKLAEYGIKPGSMVHMRARLRGGGVNPHGTRMRFRSMGVAAGGRIKQSIKEDDQDPSCWLKDMTMTIPVQILNSAGFRSVMGKDPPPSPVSARTYAAEGLPFFDLLEEPSDAFGDFEAVRSVDEVDRSRGIAGPLSVPFAPSLISNVN